MRLIGELHLSVHEMQETDLRVLARSRELRAGQGAGKEVVAPPAQSVPGRDG